jgi:hypothetical protein
MKNCLAMMIRFFFSSYSWLFFFMISWMCKNQFKLIPAYFHDKSGLSVKHLLTFNSLTAGRRNRRRSNSSICRRRSRLVHFLFVFPSRTADPIALDILFSLKSGGHIE